MHSRGFVATFFSFLFGSIAVLSLCSGVRELFSPVPILPASLTAILVLVGVLSVVVALGFWWLRPWLLLAARAWLVAATLFFMWVLLGPSNSLSVPPFAFISFGLMLLGFWSVLHHFVREVLDPFS